MKKLLLVGRSGCGKTTLMQRLKNQPIEYKKTQSVEISGDIIDTPGEYMDHKKMFRALIVTCMDAEIAVLIQDATDNSCTFFPGMQSILNMPIVGVVSKADLAIEEEIKAARSILEMAGAGNIFVISVYTSEGVTQLTEYLEQV